MRIDENGREKVHTYGAGDLFEGWPDLERIGPLEEELAGMLMRSRRDAIAIDISQFADSK